jgi:serine/threonine protein phosphatase 1
MNTRVKRIEQNTQGRDLAVGDIHGHFSRLRKVLEANGFNPAVDRLFSVGDLVDRGPESEQCLEWLDYPWFFPIKGNHEELVEQYTYSQINTGWYMDCGGAWLISKIPSERQIYADAFESLPYMIEVDTAAGAVGLIHSNVLRDDWSYTWERFSNCRDPSEWRLIRQCCLWERNRILQEDTTTVEGIRAVVVGHTPLRLPQVLGNVYHIDTAGWHTGYFTLLDLNTLKTVPPLTPKLDWNT